MKFSEVGIRFGKCTEHKTEKSFNLPEGFSEHHYYFEVRISVHNHFQNTEW